MGRRWLSFLIVCCLLFFLLSSIFGFDLYRLLYQPMLVEKNKSDIVRVDRSMSATSFAHTLKTKKLIQSDQLFITLIRIQGFTERLKAGIYRIREGESAQQFLYRVVAGDVLIESFSIIEGTTQRQVSEHLSQAEFLNYRDNDWINIEKPGQNSLSSELPISAEGLLLADTYHYDAGSTGKDLLIQAHAKLKEYLDSSWLQRSPGLPYKTLYELLIVASILEKEAANPDEKRLISGVIVNRLNKKMPLQMDPTVIYALGSQYKGKLSREDLQVDSPYNSYRYRGLPPTPIAMVGKDAIDAAAHPKSTSFLYFVARGDGGHQFSVTYDQQRQAIARYLGQHAPEGAPKENK